MPPLSEWVDGDGCNHFERNSRLGEEMRFKLRPDRDGVLSGDL